MDFLSSQEIRLLLRIPQIKKPYVSNIAKRITTKGYGLLIMGNFEKKGLISCHKEGRLKRVELTAKGKELAEAYQKIDRILNYGI